MVAIKFCAIVLTWRYNKVNRIDEEFHQDGDIVELFPCPWCCDVLKRKLSVASNS